MDKINIQAHDFRNLAELIEDRSTNLGEDKIYTFVKDNLSVDDSLSYIQLQNRVESLASHLLTLANPGDRVLLLYPSGIDYVTAFYACVCAGLIAVPVYAVQSPKDHGRLNAIAKDSDAVLACTITNLLESTTNWKNQLSHDSLKIVCTDNLPKNNGFSLRDAPSDWNDIAFLQYTSGSTGSPKGVMVSHGNLLHNASAILKGFGLVQSDIGASWLPPYHDMGLIGGIIGPLFRGIPIYLLSPFTFLKRPQRWLQVISQYGVTCTGGPNFAYDYCVKRISQKHLEELNLSSWSIAFNGAEPIHANSLTRFAHYFDSVGFNKKAFMPCYGLAESTLFVSGKKRDQHANFVKVNKQDFENKRSLIESSLSSKPESDGEHLSLVSSGVIGLEHVAVVDASTKKELAEGLIGEIWISSESVAKGYWKNSHATEETFKANIVGKSGQFMRTGDLGFMHSGELIITGRVKELIIISGRNLYPQDIEAKLRTMDSRLEAGVTAVTACKDQDNGTESVIVFQELQRKDTDPDELEHIASLLNKTVIQEYQIVPEAIVLLPTSSIPKTTSGKIQRSKSLEMYRNNAFKVLKATDSKPSTDDIPSLVNSVSTSNWELSIERIIKKYLPSGIVIPVDRPFQELGLDSKSVLAVTAELEDLVGYELNPTLVFAYPTIRDLAEFFSGTNKTSESQTANNLQTDITSKIAISGMACRFPGSDSIDEYWNNLKNARCAIGEVDENRWSWSEHFSFGGRPGFGQTRYGGFINNVDQFDAEFFGISPKEARLMDPQQRLLLEETWHALEDAGLPPKSMRGKRVGVYIGASESDYSRMVARSSSAVSPWVGTGNSLSILANRISYLYGFQGPSMTVDTACSSSLTALHLASQALRSGECDYAIVGGVNVIINPELNLVFSQAGMLAKDGLCKTFDERANGYVRGEGCGVVVLRREADCKEEHVYAVILGGAVNQDGQSNGLTAPNIRAQVDVIEQALSHANINKDAISAIECHGTGTELGDPIELSALDTVFRNYNSKIRISSVKTNIGHLESAAGIASIIKTALCLQNQTWVPSLHCDKPTPKFNWNGSPLKVQNELEQAENSSVVGVSGFGFGGTNVHLILTSRRPAKEPSENIQDLDFPVVTASAAHPDSLNKLITEYQNTIESSDNPRLIALASQQWSSHLSNRCAWVIGNKPKSIDNQSLALRSTPRSGWLFTGQGSQYAGMGKQLYEKHTVFKDAISDCNSLFDKAHGFDLTDLLWGSQSTRLNETQFTQPALYAFEVAMAKLWMSWGVSFDAFIGHSVGEYAAASLAGIFSTKAGMKLILARGQLMQQRCEQGSMLAVWLTKCDIDELLKSFPSINIAAYNSPTAQVVAGPASEIDHLATHLSSIGINFKPLKVSHAFHSQMMEPMLQAFAEVANSIEFRSPSVKIYSALNGASSQEMACPEYWVRHIIEPVQFQAAIEEASLAGINVWLEVGPGQTLCGLTKYILGPNRHTAYYPSIQENISEHQRLTDTLVGLYNSGIDVDWSTINSHPVRPNPNLKLPRYPFRTRSFWIEKETCDTNWQQARDFLGKRFVVAPQRVIYEQVYSLNRPYKLAHHTILEKVMLSAANHICAFSEITTKELGTDIVAFKEIELCEPLIISTHNDYPIQYHWDPDSNSLNSYVLKDSNTWTTLSKAELDAVSEELLALELPTEPDWQPASNLYERLRNSGYQYDSSFRWISRWGLITDSNSEWQAVANIEPPLDLDPLQKEMTFTPGWLDSLFHVCAAITDNNNQKQIFLPIGLHGLIINKSIDNVKGTVAVRMHPENSSREKSFEVAFWNSEGECVLTIEKLILKRVPTHWLSQPKSAENWQLNWLDKPRTNSTTELNEKWHIVFFNEQDRINACDLPNPLGIKFDTQLYQAESLDLNIDRLILYIDTRESTDVLNHVWNVLQELVVYQQHSLKEVILLSPECLLSSTKASINSMLLGWKRAFNNESFTIKSKIIDIAAEELTHANWQWEVAQKSNESEVILRGEQRQVPRLCSITLDGQKRSTQGPVLVTGASGDIGKRLITRLAQSPVKHIICISRTGLSDKLLNDLRTFDVDITEVKVDLTDFASLKSKLAEFSLFDSISEIFHCAGVLRDGALQDLNWQDFSDVTNAKVQGILNLEKLTHELPILANVKRWTLFSSIASLTGSMGQAHYAAANAFLDHFAHVLTNNSKVAQVINWGPWKGTSMVNSAQKSARFREQAGLYSQEPSQALDILWRTPRSTVQSLCAVIDTSRFNDFPGVSNTLFSEVIKQETVDQWSQFLDRLNKSTPEIRHELLLGALIERTRETLELGEDSEINPYKPLQELGLDSVMAVELRNEMTKITGKTLPATLLFDYPTLDAISNYLITLLYPDSSEGKQTVTVDTANQPVSDQELDSLLADMLED